MLVNTINNIKKAVDKLQLSIERNASYNHLSITGDMSELSSIIYSNLSNIGSSRMNVRLISNGRDLHPAVFIKSRIGNGLIEHSLLDNDFVNKCLNEGGTLVFDHINDHVTLTRHIQEHIESTYGLKCWVQCYVTKSSCTAFNMHADDHPFIVFQLHGSKHWIHDNEETKDYSEGDIAFYPKGKKHNVYGKGQVSMHLTIAFEGFEGHTYYDLNHNEKLEALKPRVGNALPFSIDPSLILFNSSFRGYHNFLPPNKKVGDKIIITTLKRTIKMKECYLLLLEHLQLHSSTTISEMSSRFDMDRNKVIEFVKFGIENGLIIKGL